MWYMSHDCSILYLDQLNGFTKIFKSLVDDISSRVHWFEFQSETTDVIKFARLASVDDSFDENFVQVHSSALLPTKLVESYLALLMYSSHFRISRCSSISSMMEMESGSVVAFFLDPSPWYTMALTCPMLHRTFAQLQLLLFASRFIIQLGTCLVADLHPKRADTIINTINQPKLKVPLENHEKR